MLRNVCSSSIWGAQDESICLILKLGLLRCAGGSQWLAATLWDLYILLSELHGRQQISDIVCYDNGQPCGSGPSWAATAVGGSCYSCEELPGVTSWGLPVGRAQGDLHPGCLLSALQIIQTYWNILNLHNQDRKWIWADSLIKFLSLLLLCSQTTSVNSLFCNAFCCCWICSKTENRRAPALL